MVSSAMERSCDILLGYYYPPSVIPITLMAIAWILLPNPLDCNVDGTNGVDLSFSLLGFKSDGPIASSPNIVTNGKS